MAIVGAVVRSIRCIKVKRGNKIGGIGKTVEISESKFGKRIYRRSNAVEEMWVFGGVERGSNLSFFISVEKRDRETILSTIKDWIQPGTTIVSDLWKAYDCLSEEGFICFKEDHSIDFKDPEILHHTNTIESLFRHSKKSMPQFHWNKCHFDGYLAKIMLLKYCKRNSIDVLKHFFKIAGSLYNPLQPYFHENDNTDDYEIEIV